MIATQLPVDQLIHVSLHLTLAWIWYKIREFEENADIFLMLLLLPENH